MMNKQLTDILQADDILSLVNFMNDQYDKLSEQDKNKFLKKLLNKVNDKLITPNSIDYPSYVWEKYEGVEIYERLIEDKKENEDNDIINYSLLKYFTENNDQEKARIQLNILLKKIDEDPDKAYLIEFCKIYRYNDFNYVHFLEQCHNRYPNNHVILHMLVLSYMSELNVNKIEHYLGIINDNLDFQVEFTDHLYYRLDDVVIGKLEQRFDYSNICKLLSIIENWNFQYFQESELSLNRSFYFEEYRKQSVANAKSEERNKIIASLSHSIKNIIASVIDPLKNLQKEGKYRPKIINDAIRGTELIREMVTAINYSYKGSIEDFYSDAENDIDIDSITINQIISEALKVSIENMFDSKYHSKFLRNYFPNRKQFEKAKSNWDTIEQKLDEDQLLAFAKDNMFNISLQLDSVCNLKIGNKNGSAVKLSILFQEMLLNAVKYSSYVARRDRYIKLQILSKDNKIKIKMENSYHPNLRSKTSGLGQTVINNIARMLESEPIITKNDEKNRYSVELVSPNFWKKK